MSLRIAQVINKLNGLRLNEAIDVQKLDHLIRSDVLSKKFNYKLVNKFYDNEKTLYSIDSPYNGQFNICPTGGKPENGKA